MKHTKRSACAFAFVFFGSFLLFFAWCGLSGASECDPWAGVPPITLSIQKSNGAAQEPCDENAEDSRCRSPQNLVLTISELGRYHGDVCAGVALGYRACQIALAALYPGEVPTRNDQFVICGAERGCPADAVAFITGARYGKGSNGVFNGNYVIDKDIGEFNFIFASMSNGKAFKLVKKFPLPDRLFELREKIFSDPESAKKFKNLSHCLARRILSAPDKDIFEVVPLNDFSWKEEKEKRLK